MPRAAERPTERRDCSLGYAVATPAVLGLRRHGQVAASGVDGGTPRCPCGCPQHWVGRWGWACPHCDPEITARGGER